MRPIVLVALLACLPSGCTWVHMTPSAGAVKVVESAPAGCEARGEVEVSVKDGVAFYDRNPRKVRDELETLARNEAPDLGADTIAPLGPSSDGTQRFAAWRCQR